MDLWAGLLHNMSMHADLIFLHGRHVERCIASVDKHFEYHTLQLMTAGGVELFYDDRRVEMHGAWVWPCHPGPWIRFHEWPRGEPWEHRYMAMTGPRVAGWVAEGLWPVGAERVDDPAVVRRLAGWMDEAIAEAGRSGRWARLRATNAIERVLLDCAERRSSAAMPQRPAWLDQVLARLADLSGEEPGYAALAEQHAMSLTTLRRRFRQLTGTSPHEHRLAARITAARDLLGDSDLPIKTIAQQLGYRDVFFFTRQFSQRVGVTPAAYRRSRQG